MALIHLTPKFIASSAARSLTLDLVDVKSAELALNLKNGRDLTIRRPWPNKQHNVVCRKVGQKAVLGLLVERDQLPDQFTLVTRWALHGERILTHTVRFILVDRDFDFLSDLMIMWSRQSDPAHKSRWPEVPEYHSPAATQPRMTLEVEPERKGIYRDVVGADGLLTAREETVYVPTLERGRLESFDWADRLPDLRSAF